MAAGGATMVVRITGSDTVFPPAFIASTMSVYSVAALSAENVAELLVWLEGTTIEPLSLYLYAVARSPPVQDATNDWYVIEPTSTLGAVGGSGKVVITMASESAWPPLFTAVITSVYSVAPFRSVNVAESLVIIVGNPADPLSVNTYELACKLDQEATNEL